MKTIYMVFHTVYDYDGNEWNAILSTPHLHKAEAKKAEQEKLRDDIVAATATLREHMRIWDAINPRVHPGTIKPKKVPTPSGPRKKWTQEQRDEHDRVKVENYDAAVAAAKPAQDWVNIRYAEQCRFTATLPQDVQDNQWKYNEKSCFEIEEVPYEE